MNDQNIELEVKLINLSNETGYPIIQHNGQRKFGPPSGWTRPQRGCEVFVGKLPRDLYEDELVPVMSRAGKIYELRLMMDFSGSNRGYAFATYTNKRDAFIAVRELNGFEIRPGRHIGVVKSLDNCRLLVCNIPKTKTKGDVYKDLSKLVEGIMHVTFNKNDYDLRLNNGFAFVEFSSHRAAAIARRSLVECIRLWDQDVDVDWADPESDFEDNGIAKVLYAKNFLIETTANTIQSAVENAIGSNIERVRKIYDYAYIHFFERSHAELAIAKLKDAEVDGSVIDIKWAKSYRVNTSCNKSIDQSQTKLIYKQPLEKKRYECAPEKANNIGSSSAGNSSSGSPTNLIGSGVQNSNYIMSPNQLESMCKRYNWAPPIYDYKRYQDPSGCDVWYAGVEMPYVDLPLLQIPKRIGWLVTGACCSVYQAHIEAAAIALRYLKSMGANIIQRSCHPINKTIAPPVPGCGNITYDNPTVTSTAWGAA